MSGLVESVMLAMYVCSASIAGEAQGDDGREDDQAMTAMHIVYLALGLTALMVVLKLIVRKIGCNCHECGRRMAFFNEVGDDDQREILRYFEEFEKRTPDTSGMFVCCHCGIVYDDFSGEKRSMAGDLTSYCKVCNGLVAPMDRYVMRGLLPEFRKANPELAEKGADCLNCGRKPIIGDCVFCDAKLKLFGCHKCAAVYAWMPATGGQLKFLVPLTDKELLDRVSDIYLGSA